MPAAVICHLPRASRLCGGAGRHSGLEIANVFHVRRQSHVERWRELARCSPSLRRVAPPQHVGCVINVSGGRYRLLGPVEKTPATAATVRGRGRPTRERVDMQYRTRRPNRTVPTTLFEAGAVAASMLPEPRLT